MRWCSSLEALTAALAQRFEPLRAARAVGARLEARISRRLPSTHQITRWLLPSRHSTTRSTRARAPSLARLLAAACGDARAPRACPSAVRRKRVSASCAARRAAARAGCRCRRRGRRRATSRPRPVARRPLPPQPRAPAHRARPPGETEAADEAESSGGGEAGAPAVAAGAARGDLCSLRGSCAQAAPVGARGGLARCRRRRMPLAAPRPANDVLAAARPVIDAISQRAPCQRRGTAPSLLRAAACALAAPRTRSTRPSCHAAISTPEQHAGTRAVLHAYAPRRARGAGSPRASS